MGGRIASQVVAQGAAVDALALFAYPLHPPASPSKWRDKHLPLIETPTLFCSGTRDNFATPEELRQATSKVPNGRLHLLEAADHGFHVPKSGGRTREDVWQEAVSVLADWLEHL
jgi:predicted alpha/beta-hydrolase family hydrolase